MLRTRRASARTLSNSHRSIRVDLAYSLNPPSFTGFSGDAGATAAVRPEPASVVACLPIARARDSHWGTSNSSSRLDRLSDMRTAILFLGLSTAFGGHRYDRPHCRSCREEGDSSPVTSSAICGSLSFSMANLEPELGRQAGRPRSA